MAYGANNGHDYSPQQDAVAISRGLFVTYRDVSGNIVTVSGYKNGGRTIVYQRDVVGLGAIDALYWSYPATEKTQWDALVTRTAQAFQPGDVAAISYSRYTDPRFGFTTLWPSSFNAQPQPPLTDVGGQAWASPDGQVLLSAYGADNVHYYSPKQDAVADSKGLLVTYSSVSGNIVTVSGYKNGGRTIVYQRDVVGHGAIDTLYWSYPATEKTQWDALVTRTAQAFQPGNVTIPH